MTVQIKTSGVIAEIGQHFIAQAVGTVDIFILQRCFVKGELCEDITGVIIQKAYNTALTVPETDKQRIVFTQMLLNESIRFLGGLQIYPFAAYKV